MASHTPQQMTTAEAVVASLVAHGIDTVYALPGIQNDHLFDALYKAGNRIRTVHTRHEQGSAYMALGAALATGKPQAFAVVNGPGLLNASAALLTAYSMNAPVLALVGEIPARDIGRNIGHLHELRGQADMIARLVGHSAQIGAPADAPRRVAEAMRAMATGRRGPAALGLPDRRVGRERARDAATAARAARARDRRRCRPGCRKAPRRRQQSDDHLRRRRAGCRRRRSRSSRPCCRPRCSAIGAAAACSTAAIRSA